MKRLFATMLFGSILTATTIQAGTPTNVVIHTVAPGSNGSAPTSATLSPDEWQEFRAARMAAMKANPALATKATLLQVKLRNFEQKLNAAMVQTDPSVGPILAKFAANRPPLPHVPNQIPAKTP